MERATRRLRLLLIVAVVVACVGGSVALVALAPRGGEQLVGVSISAGRLAARLPRRALTCAPLAPGATAETCRATIAGDELRVTVRYGRRGGFDFASCEATYRGATAACRATNYTLAAGLPRYAGVEAAALGLDAAALGDLRARYPLDNFYEADWLRWAPRVAAALALAVALALALLPWERRSARPLAGIGGGVLVFVALRVGFGGLLVITGLVD